MFFIDQVTMSIGMTGVGTIGDSKCVDICFNFVDKKPFPTKNEAWDGISE